LLSRASSSMSAGSDAAPPAATGSIRHDTYIHTHVYIDVYKYTYIDIHTYIYKTYLGSRWRRRAGRSLHSYSTWAPRGPPHPYLYIYVCKYICIYICYICMLYMYIYIYIRR
jgi:hypothetical protein